MGQKKQFLRPRGGGRLDGGTSAAYVGPGPRAGVHVSIHGALSLSLSLLSFNRDRHLMFMFFYQTVSIVFLFMRTIYVYKMCFSTKLVVVLHDPGHVQESWLFVNFVLAVIGCSSACSAAVHP